MSKKFKIILHIGTEKTGTTTLQSAMLANKAHLLANGIFYLHGEDIPNSRDIAAACIGDQARDDYLDSKNITSPERRRAFRAKLRQDVQKKVAALPSGTHTLLISSEHFHSRLREPSMIQYLRDWLSSYATNFQVICYLRRQVDMVTSLYSTILKGGGIESFENAVNRMIADEHYCNYDIFLSKWESVFSCDCMTVRKFDRSELFCGSIVEDFLLQAGIPLDTLIVRPPPKNESVTHLGQALLYQINLLAKSSTKPSEVLFHKLRRSVASAYAGKGLQLPAEYAEQLQARFAESNRAVKNRWFPGHKHLFSGKFDENDHRELNDEQERVLSEIFESLFNENTQSDRFLT